MQMIRAAALTIALSGLPPAGAEVTMSTRAGKVGGPPILVIAGHQSHDCAPALQDTRVEHGELWVIAHRAHVDCVRAETRWEIVLGPEDLDLKALPDPVVPVRFLVSQGDDSVRVTRLEAFDLLVRAPVPVRPETGLWWGDASGQHPVSGPGTGYSIELQGDQLLMMSNLYDRSGAPSWLFSSGRLDGAVVRAPLLTLFGGQPLFSDYLPPEAAIETGRVLLQFHDPASATAWFVAGTGDGAEPDLRVQAISLTRYAFALGDRERILEGSWLWIGEDGLSVRRLELRPTGLLAGAATFADVEGAIRIECSGGGPQSAPQVCQIGDDDGLIGYLDRVGLNRLNGRTVDGRAIDLIRWQR